MNPTAPAAAPRRSDTTGRWLCNAAADCDNQAVTQWASPDPTDADADRTVPVYACAEHTPTA